MRLFSAACLVAGIFAHHESSEIIVPDKEYCENKHVQIHVGKRGKIVREGTDSMILRVKNPCSEESNYTAMVVFNREQCGADFLKAIEDSRVT